MRFAKAHHNIVILGDFNVRPQSVVGQFMNGKYPEITDLEFPDRGEFVISECIKLYQNFNFELYRKFNFINCFAQYKQHRDGLGEGALDKWEDGFPEMSNYTKDFKAWIDHIFIN